MPPDPLDWQGSDNPKIECSKHAQDVGLMLGECLQPNLDPLMCMSWNGMLVECPRHNCAQCVISISTVAAAAGAAAQAVAAASGLTLTVTQQLPLLLSMQA